MVFKAPCFMCRQVIVDELIFAVQQIQQRVVMSSFQNRLNEACSVSPKVPRFGKGQQTCIARELGCSQEAVRKWFSGESIPRAKMGQKLAKFLDVSHTWLLMGAAYGEVDVAIKQAKNHDAAVYASVAYAIMWGAGVSICGDEHCADMIVINNGSMTHVSARGAVETDKKNVFLVTFRKIQIKECTTVAVFHEVNKDFSVKSFYLEIPTEAWQGGGVKVNANEVTLTFSRKGNSFESNGIKFNNFLR